MQICNACDGHWLRRCCCLFCDGKGIVESKPSPLIELQEQGKLLMDCLFCNSTLKGVKLNVFNRCECCGSEMVALPSPWKDNPEQCRVGHWKSKIH